MVEARNVEVRKGREPEAMDTQEKGPFNMDYFELLAHHLGEEWKKLAEKLGVNRARVQSIIQNNVHFQQRMEGYY